MIKLAKIAAAVVLLAGSARADITTGLVLRAKLNEAPGTTAIEDYTGIHADGTFNGGPFVTTAAPAKFPGQTAINFTAADSEYISFADAADLEFTATGMTVAFWIKAPATATYDAVFTKSTAGFDSGYEVYGNDTNAFHLFVFQGGPALQHGWGTPVFQDNTWRHVVGTVSYNGTGASTTYYLDGAVNPGGTFGPTAVTPTANASAVNIARRSALGSNFLNGALFDVRFYNRPLSAGDVAELFNYGEARIVPIVQQLLGRLDQRSYLETYGVYAIALP
jgi:hypothetical protein